MDNKYKRRGRGLDNRNLHNLDRKTYRSFKEFETAEPLKSMEGWILFITNLHEETTEDDLKTAFNEYGDVKNASLNLDRRTGFVKGYALVEYNRYEEASFARESMNESEFLGMVIKVNWCFATGPSNETRGTTPHLVI